MDSNNNYASLFGTRQDLYEANAVLTEQVFLLNRIVKNIKKRIYIYRFLLIFSVLLNLLFALEKCNV